MFIVVIEEFVAKDLKFVAEVTVPMDEAEKWVTDFRADAEKRGSRYTARIARLFSTPTPAEFLNGLIQAAA